MNSFSMRSLGTSYDYVASEELVRVVNRLLSEQSGDRDTSITGSGARMDSNTFADLRGLGKDLWKGVEINDYIGKLRDEWSR